MQPLDRRDRRWALLLSVVSAVAVLVLAARIHRSGAPLWLDTQGQRVAFGHLFGIPVVPGPAARLVVSLGNTAVFGALVGLVIVAALALHDRISALVAAAACPLALLATERIGKPLVGRQAHGGYAFPSGHTTAMATVVALVALLIYRHARRSGLLTIAPVAVLVPAMGLALVRVNAHRLSDTVAGALIGWGAVLGLTWVISALVASRASSSPQPS